MKKPHIPNIKKAYTLYKTYAEMLTSYGTRRPNFPEYVSEGLIRTILNKKGDLSVKKCKGTDLMSDIEGRQECKCFVSTGPLSFGPNQIWSVLYVLDATKMNVDRFKLYRVGMNSDDFSNIQISKNQTYLDQCLLGRRPKILWSSLMKKIPSNKISVVFDDHIDKIL